MRFIFIGNKRFEAQAPFAVRARANGVPFERIGERLTQAEGYNVQLFVDGYSKNALSFQIIN